MHSLGQQDQLHGINELGWHADDLHSVYWEVDQACWVCRQQLEMSMSFKANLAQGFFPTFFKK